MLVEPYNAIGNIARLHHYIPFLTSSLHYIPPLCTVHYIPPYHYITLHHYIPFLTVSLHYIPPLCTVQCTLHTNVSLHYIAPLHPIPNCITPLHSTAAHCSTARHFIVLYSFSASSTHLSPGSPPFNFWTVATVLCTYI